MLPLQTNRTERGSPRIEHLIEAMARPECPALHLVIVGTGPEFERLKGVTVRAGLANRLFTGSVSEERKWQILHSADIYASTTMHEGFGLVYLEAMAAGLPVITCDRGGQVDFLRDGETGFLIPEGSQVALARAFALAAA